VFGDFKLVAEYRDGKWGTYKIVPFAEEVKFSSASSLFSSGQNVYEGFKAYLTEDNRVGIFCINEHYKRFTSSSERMSIPPVPSQLFIDGIKELVKTDSKFVPPASTGEGAGLYIRAYVVASEDFLGIRPSTQYTFVVYTSPVPSLFYSSISNSGLKVYCDASLVRAWEGGVGNVKTAGTYGAAMNADKIAKSKGFDSVLYLDAKTKSFFEECTVLNIFFVLQDGDGVEVLTPSLESGTILGGITRKSVMALVAKQLNIPVIERKISVDEIINHYERGALLEIFGTGTASGVVSISTIRFEHKNRSIVLKNSPNLRPKIMALLLDVYKGKADPHGWLEEVRNKSPNKKEGKIDKGAMMGWTIYHNAIRTDMQFFVENSVNSDADTINELKSRYEFFYAMHILHGLVEERVIFPLVAKKCDDYENVVKGDLLEHHECLEFLLNELKEACEQLQPNSPPSLLKVIHLKFKLLQEINCHHMAEEEKFVLTAVNNKMSKEETVELLQGIVADPCPPSVSMADKEKQYAWMVMSLPVYKATIFLARLPPPALKKMAPSLQKSLPRASWAHLISKIPHLNDLY
jgi:branched-chain amino acid aminotransferase